MQIQKKKSELLVDFVELGGLKLYMTKSYIARATNRQMLHKNTKFQFMVTPRATPESDTPPPRSVETQRRDSSSSE